MKLNKGFTLIEIIGVIVIISVLTRISYPIYYKNAENAKNVSAISDSKNMDFAYKTLLLDIDTVKPGDSGNLRDDSIGQVSLIKNSDNSGKKIKKWDGPYLYHVQSTNPWGGKHDILVVPTVSAGYLEDYYKADMESNNDFKCSLRDHEKKESPDKIKICHTSEDEDGNEVHKTEEINTDDLESYLEHGDSEGACEDDKTKDESFSEIYDSSVTTWVSLDEVKPSTAKDLEKRIDNNDKADSAGKFCYDKENRKGYIYIGASEI